MRRRGLALLALLALAALVGACGQMRPRPGELVTLEVRDVLTPREARRGPYPILQNALDQGVSEAQVRAGRLIVAICAEPGRGDDPERKYVALLDDGLPLREGQHLRLTRGAIAGEEGAPGRVLGVLPAPPAEQEHVWKYGRVVRCAQDDSGDRGDVITARFARAVPAWHLDDQARHRARMRLAGEPALAAGRVVRAVCALGTDYWSDWTVLLPAELRAGRGEVLRARAGEDDEAIPARLTEAIEVIPRPRDGYRVHGSDIVRCHPR